MSRLATRNKADRATKGNAHRKRKMAEAFPPSSNGVGIAKLNPNSKTLPPLSMGQPQSNAASGSPSHQPSFQGSLVSGSQPPSFVRASSQPLAGLPTMDASKRVKLEQGAAASAPGSRPQPKSSRQPSVSKQAPNARRPGSSKQTSASRQSSEDAQTHTDRSSKQTASRQRSPPLADCVTSATASGPSDPVNRPEAPTAASVNPQQRSREAEEQVTFPFRIVKGKAAQPASSSGLIGSSSAADAAAATAAQPAASKPAVPAQPGGAHPQASAGAVSASVAGPEDNQAAASAGGENCMDALAEAAAAASEGSAASSSSHTDDDKDAAEILRDLHNSAGLPQNVSPNGGEL